MVVLWKANPKCVQNLIAFISGRAREKEEEQRGRERGPLWLCVLMSVYLDNCLSTLGSSGGHLARNTHFIR